MFRVAAEYDIPVWGALTQRYADRQGLTGNGIYRYIQEVRAIFKRHYAPEAQPGRQCGALSEEPCAHCGQPIPVRRVVKGAQYGTQARYCSDVCRVRAAAKRKSTKAVAAEMDTMATR